MEVNIIYMTYKIAWEFGKVPGDVKKAKMIPLCKGKGTREECKNYRGVKLLSTVVH